MLTTIDPSTVPPPPGGWFSHAARVEVGTGALLFVSGQVAVDDTGEIVDVGDMASQAERVFAMLERILTDQGGSFDDVVSIRTFLTDMSLLPAYGAVRARYITGTPPTSTTVAVAGLYRSDALVEVEIVAAIGG